MLVYPLCYLFLTVPLAIYRIAGISGHPWQLDAQLVCGSIFTLAGFVDSIVFCVGLLFFFFFAFFCFFALDLFRRSRPPSKKKKKTISLEKTIQPKPFFLDDFFDDFWWFFFFFWTQWTRNLFSAITRDRSRPSFSTGSSSILTPSPLEKKESLPLESYVPHPEPIKPNPIIGLKGILQGGSALQFMPAKYSLATIDLNSFDEASPWGEESWSHLLLSSLTPSYAYQGGWTRWAKGHVSSFSVFFFKFC